MPKDITQTPGGEEKFRRCVGHVKEHNLIALGEGGKQVNPYAVCTVALRKALKRAKRRQKLRKRSSKK